MAIFDGKFIRGAAGDVIFKKNGKKQVIQGKSKKDKIDMTQATYDASFIFGRASTLACYIRVEASNLIRFNDNGMISRFTGECNQVIQKSLADKNEVTNFSQEYFGRLNGFEFHNGSPVKNHLFAQPMVTLTEQLITIDVPEMQIPRDLTFPSYAKSCVVAFNVTLFDLKNDRYKSQEIQSFEVKQQPGTPTFPAQQLNFSSAPGALCIISLGLYYFEETFAGRAMINNKDMSPSAILKAAFCPGESEVQAGWAELTFNDKNPRKIKKNKKAK